VFFVFLFLTSKGLYAKVFRLLDIKKSSKVVHVMVAGPSTMALVHSLHIIFQTLVIQKKPATVVLFLDAVKKIFGKFGDLLDSRSATARNTLPACW
jgi:DNA recombination protein RmuC